jgi:hypothetical protein
MPHIGGSGDHELVRESTESDSPPSTSRSVAARILSDCVSGLFAVAALVFTVVGLLERLVPIGWVVALAVWTAVIGVGALPALGMLLVAPPRVPLRERSALVASASWFGRAIWASGLFGLSVVIGAIAGVVAAKAVESTPGFDLTDVLGQLAILVLWPSVLLVAAIAYVILGGAIIADDHGTAVRALLEKRWRVPLASWQKYQQLVDLILELSLGFFSRGALILTMVTVGAVAWAFIVSW